MITIAFLARITKVAQLGSGIPRILEAYPEESSRFLEFLLRITLPSAVSVSSSMQDTMQGIMQVTPPSRETSKDI